MSFHFRDVFSGYVFFFRGVPGFGPLSSSLTNYGSSHQMTFSFGSFSPTFHRQADPDRTQESPLNSWLVVGLSWWFLIFLRQPGQRSGELKALPNIGNLDSVDK